MFEFGYVFVNDRGLYFVWCYRREYQLCGVWLYIGYGNQVVEQVMFNRFGKFVECVVVFFDVLMGQDFDGFQFFDKSVGVQVYVDMVIDIIGFYYDIGWVFVGYIFFDICDYD